MQYYYVPARSNHRRTRYLGETTCSHLPIYTVHSRKWIKKRKLGENEAVRTLVATPSTAVDRHTTLP